MTSRQDRPGDSGEPAPLVIAHVSDLHIGAHLPSVAEELVADVSAAAPALTVVTGDSTMRARIPQFRHARALLDQLPRPHLVVIGNHDVPLAPVRRLVAPYARYQTLFEPELDPLVQLPGLCALGLQSMPRWRWKGGRVSRRQGGAVVEILGAAPPAAARLLALHHPPFPRGTARVVGRAGLVAALARAQVDLVLAGHTHRPCVRTVDLTGADGSHRVVEVVAGTATSRRVRGVARSWSLIRIGSTTVTVEERYESGSGWHLGRTAQYPRAPR